MAIHIDSSVIEQLKQADPDRVRSAQLADPDIRDRLLTLYAFHSELAKVPELVSEPMMGAIRYQWWRDCIDKIYLGQSVRAHEVSQPLAELIAQSGISRFLLDRIIDGRERDLDPTPFPDLDAATAYVDATSGALARAAVTLCGGDAQSGLLAGRAWGLCGLARSYRYYCDKILKELEFTDILDAAMVAYAEAELTSNSVPALAYAGLVPGFVKRMRKSGYEPQQHVPSYAPFAKQVRMLRIVATGRF
ncbi:MAG: squalene/phytoene synthase family protein [Pseudomonadota bacterium]